MKNGVLKNFAKFTGKHLCQSLFFNKVTRLLRNFAKFTGKYLCQSFFFNKVARLLRTFTKFTGKQMCQRKTCCNVFLFFILSIWTGYKTTSVLLEPYAGLIYLMWTNPHETVSLFKLTIDFFSWRTSLIMQQRSQGGSQRGISENRNETLCKSFSVQNLVALAIKYVKFIVKLK